MIFTCLILSVLSIPVIFYMYMLYKMIFDFHDTAYSRSLSWQGYDYYKANDFFLEAIKKSEYLEGKKQEALARKESRKIKKDLRNS